MNKKLRKNKYLLFVIGSWLLARLKWSFEISRLAIFRTRRRTEIRHVIKQNRLLSNSCWSFDGDFMTLMSYNSEDNFFLLYKFSNLEKN